jgi:glucosamine-6-phosphate deaminase
MPQVNKRGHPMQIRTFDDKQQLGKQAAADGAVAIRRAIQERREANIIVATGASQFEMLDTLAGEPDIAWHRVTGFHWTSMRDCRSRILVQ